MLPWLTAPLSPNHSTEVVTEAPSWGLLIGPDPMNRMINTHLIFSAFQVTGHDVEDLRQSVPEFFPSEDYPSPVRGRLYISDLYLEAVPAAGPSTIWSVEVGSTAQQGTQSSCEAELYGFYASELISDPDVRAFLVDEAPESNYLGARLEDSMEILRAIYVGFQKVHGYTLASAEDAFAAREDGQGSSFPPEHLDWLQKFCCRWDRCSQDADRRKHALTELARNQHLAPPTEGRRPSTIAGPERPPGYTDDEWKLVVLGWNMQGTSVTRPAGP